LGSLVGAFSFLAWTASAGPYSAYDVTTLIPFEDQTDPTWNDKVHVYMRIGSATGRLLRPWIDTGSTGVVLPASLVPGFNQNKCNSFNEGYHYLTSSNILYLGCWLPQDLYFNTEETNHAVVHAQVPVFAVHTKVECAAGTDDVDVIRTGTCTGTSTADPTGFWFVGIGWGRIDDGKPQGTSDKNPLINVADVEGVADITRLYKGFTVTKDGIVLGLTDANTDGIDWTDLPLHQDSSSGGGGGGSGTRNWGQIPACLWFGTQVPGTDACQEVAALLDTGIDESYLRMPKSTGTLPPHDAGGLVDEGTAVTVSFKPMGVGDWLLFYPHDTFVVDRPTGDKQDVMPRQMTAFKKDGYVVKSFFNSGRHVFRKYEVTHDAKLVKVDFRVWMDPS
jgi:hypothetical protein